jgi:hypothetical protein
LIYFKKDLPELQKIEIKYGYEGFDIWKNFPYKNFHIFKKDYELKFRESLGFEFG